MQIVLTQVSISCIASVACSGKSTHACLGEHCRHAAGETGRTCMQIQKVPYGNLSDRLPLLK